MLRAGFERFVHPDDRPAVGRRVHARRAPPGRVPRPQSLPGVAPSGGEGHRPARGPPDSRDRPERPRHHRARAARGPAHRAGVPRRAHGPAQPGAVPRPPRPGARALGLARRTRSPCSCSIWTASSRSTTRSATTPATRCCARSSRRVSDITRPSDTVARLGGDEFALLLEAAEENQVVSVASRILDSAWPSRCASPSASWRWAPASGSSSIAADAGKSEELIRHADLAMYAAKEAGRGRWEIFEDEMTREVGELLGLEHELRLGLGRGEFSLHYQPEISLDTRSIVGVEALLRWNSPKRGSVPPTRFIPIAEATGLILPLGEWVIRAACAQAARGATSASFREQFVMWVNLSARQLAAGGVSDVVQAALAGGRSPGGLPRARGHRERDRRGGLSWASGPAPSCRSCATRRSRGDRRLRDRVLLAGSAAPLPGGHAQGRPLVRRRRRAQRQGRGDHREPGQPRPRARPESPRPRESSRTASWSHCASWAATWPRATSSLDQGPADQITGMLKTPQDDAADLGKAEYRALSPSGAAEFESDAIGP